MFEQIKELYVNAIGQVIVQLRSANTFLDKHSELVALNLSPLDDRYEDEKRFRQYVGNALGNAAERAQAFRELFACYSFSKMGDVSDLAFGVRCHSGYGSELKTLIESTTAELRAIQSLVEGLDLVEEVSSLKEAA